jgi:outer membrane protein OmpA-like peptidoglycan-associated protein
MNLFKQTALVLTLSALVGCAANDPYQRSKTGTAVGAAVGAVLGHQMNSDRGRFVGAAVGAITGAAVGSYMDKQEAALQKQLAQEQAAKQVKLERIDEETLKLNIDSAVTFDFDSSRLQPSFYRSLNKVASVLSQYNKTAVHIIGHTDSTGSAGYNQGLSTRRASAVGRYLSSHGVMQQRTLLEGRGESDPLRSNSSEYGRQQNRRVEIYLKTIVEGREQKAFERI